MVSALGTIVQMVLTMSQAFYISKYMSLLSSCKKTKIILPPRQWYMVTFPVFCQIKKKVFLCFNHHYSNNM